MNNKLLIAAAGSGKTTYLINEAMKFRDEKVLITTYTEENAEEIKKKIIERYKSIPSHIMIQTWFSFLIKHGVKPYQGTFNELLFDYEIKGMVLNNGEFGFKYFSKKLNAPVPFKEDEEFLLHYFIKSQKIISDRLPKFVVKSNKAVGGELINRISRIYQHIFIDEVQDLAGYDLEIIKLLFRTNSNIILVGDPRQVTYLTHHERKYGKYKDGKIKEFIMGECKRPITYDIDENTLNSSHRNNKDICLFSSRLYDVKAFNPIKPCECPGCRNDKIGAEGIYLVKPEDVENYLFTFAPVQLRWNVLKEMNSKYPIYNFGSSKGKTFNRVLIYPTDEIEKWIYNNTIKLASQTRAKFYVAITRAKYSVGIVTDFPDGTDIEGVQLYKPNKVEN